MLPTKWYCEQSLSVRHRYCKKSFGANVQLYMNHFRSDYVSIFEHMVDLCALEDMHGSLEETIPSWHTSYFNKNRQS